MESMEPGSCIRPMEVDCSCRIQLPAHAGSRCLPIQGLEPWEPIWGERWRPIWVSFGVPFNWGPFWALFYLFGAHLASLWALGAISGGALAYFGLRWLIFVFCWRILQSHPETLQTQDSPRQNELAKPLSLSDRAD